MSAPDALAPADGSPPGAGEPAVSKTATAIVPTDLTAVSPDDRRYKRFELLRDYLKHEDNLVDHRIKWNLTIQGFLFTAFGFSLQKADNPLLQELASLLIPIAGSIISLCATCGIFAAHLSLKSLARHWEPKNDAPANKGDWLPTLGGGGASTALIVGLVASFGPAMLIAAIWGVICLQLHDIPHSLLIGAGALVVLAVTLVAWDWRIKKSGR
jgi:hypothetical protein